VVARRFCNRLCRRDELSVVEPRAVDRTRVYRDPSRRQEGTARRRPAGRAKDSGASVDWSARARGEAAHDGDHVGDVETIFRECSRGLRVDPRSRADGAREYFHGSIPSVQKRVPTPRATRLQRIEDERGKRGDSRTRRSAKTLAGGGAFYGRLKRAAFGTRACDVRWWREIAREVVVDQRIGDGRAHPSVHTGAQDAIGAYRVHWLDDARRWRAPSRSSEAPLRRRLRRIRRANRP
jgi:hypothetical protein